MKQIFKKLEDLFSVESTKSDKTTFPYKTALSEANIKVNRIESTKWTQRIEFFQYTFFYNQHFYEQANTEINKN